MAICDAAEVRSITAVEKERIGANREAAIEKDGCQ